jgi:hypothetical protein
MAIQPGNKIAPVRIRGARVTAPPGYVVGRVGSEPGEVQLISIADLGANMQKIGAVPKPMILHPTYLVFGAGLFAANEQISPAPAPQAVNFPSIYPGETSTVSCQVSPHGNVQFVLAFNVTAYLAGGYPNGCVAKCNISAGQTTGTVTYAATEYSLAAGGLLTMVMPSTPDPALAGVSAIFIGDPTTT